MDMSPMCLIVFAIKVCVDLCNNECVSLITGIVLTHFQLNESTTKMHEPRHRHNACTGSTFSNLGNSTQRGAV